MAKDKSQRELEQGIVSSAPAAARVADASRLLPMVLLRDVPLVQCAYESWRARAERYEEAGRFTREAATESLFADSVQLNALVRDLRLQRYQSWLPKMLRWEFQRAIEDAPRVEVTVPEGLVWERPGKRPKSGGPKGYRLEDLERSVTWFVACEVNGKHIAPFADEQGVARPTVYDAIKRVETLLGCINHPFPDDTPS